MDYDTGAVLAQKAGDAKMYPSSMTKMMTLYLVFDRLKQGTLKLDSTFTVSERAWRMQGSKMFVPLGAQIPLEDLIRGIAIQSGNDACITVAEGIAGSEDAFAALMNDKAKQLGMNGSHFMDSSGWPNPEHYTTAHDLAILAAALIRDFPQYYHYFGEREYTYHGIRQYNRNLLLGNAAMLVDVLKTGHTELAGYGITLSAHEPATGRRLVLVVNGLNSEAERAQEGERLMSWGLHNFDNVTLFKAGQTVAKAKVWLGEHKHVPLTIERDAKATIGKIGAKNVKTTVEYTGPLDAPVKKGQAVGKLKVTLPSGAVEEFPLVTAADVAPLSRVARIPHVMARWLWLE
jgi:D-alanyl-D-alanine carboxypeptidase (penicillin-binding protein 5/6)